MKVDNCGSSYGLLTPLPSLKTAVSALHQDTSSRPVAGGCQEGFVSICLTKNVKRSAGVGIALVL